MGDSLNHMKDIRLIKILSIFAFSLLVLSLLIIIVTPTAKNYEINIYNVYPWYFWMFMVLSTFAGTLILLQSYISKLKNNYWILGFAAILMSNFILLTLPTIRNYIVFGRGDILTHIGWMKNIVLSGSFGTDMYPNIHVLGTVIHYFSGITLDNISTLVFPVFSIFYILSFYLLYSEILKDKSKVVLAMVFTSIMVFGTSHTSFAPFNLSFFTIPIFIYLYIKEKSSNELNFRILLLIAVPFLLLFHPLTSLMLLVSLIIIEFSGFIYSKINKSITDSSGRFSYLLIGIFMAGLIIWKSYLYQIQNGLDTFYSFLVSGATPNLSSALLLAHKANITDIISSIGFIYGNWMIIILAGLITIYLLMKRNIFSINLRKLLKNPRSLLSYRIFEIFSSLENYEIYSILGFLFFVIISIFVYIKLPLFGFTRILEFTIFFANFLIFTLFYLILKSKRRILNFNKYAKILLISLILFPIIFFSTLNLYLSPLTITPNEQVTTSEINGMETFFSNKNNETRILELGLSQYRFLAYVNGEKADEHGQDIYIANISNSSKTAPIDHFGFNNNTSMGQFYNASVYLVINTLGEESYPVLYPGYANVWRFTPADFILLNDSDQIMLIYNNGNLKIYKAMKNS